MKGESTRSAANGTAIVLGAGMAGLWTARVLADHFSRVTVIERDLLPPAPAVRPGVPQARQYHVLLLRGLALLDHYFPCLRDELLAAGAITFDANQDVKTQLRGHWLRRYPSDTRLLSVSRALLETAVRNRVAALPEVTFLQGAAATSLLSGPGGSVGGVAIRFQQGPHKGEQQELAADFVVDASGRSSRAPSWLAALGFDKPRQSTVNAKLGYASRRYKRPAHPPGDWQMLLVSPTPPDQPRSGLIFPEEDGTWIVMLGGINGTYPPTEPAEFDAYARGLAPDFAAALDAAKPLGPAYGYRRTDNRWLHYEELDRWPERFVVLGDAFCAFNPVYGQGMTVAGLSAQTLDDLLTANGGLLHRLAPRFQRAVARVTARVWRLATSADREWPGTVADDDGGLFTRASLWYTARLLDAIPTDNHLRETFLEVNQLVRPATDLAHPAILWRVGRSLLPL